MLSLLQQGNYQTFALLIVAIVFALSFHEFAHAASAKYFGDRTAEQQGRLTLSPLSHIDPLGMLFIVLVGFGWARPVPTTPRNFNSRWAMPLVAAAGPASNLLLAFLAINLHGVLLLMGLEFASGQATLEFFRLFVLINVVLMLFNLIPLGPLDGHYIFPYLLPRRYAQTYVNLNQRYGTMLLLGLFMLSIAGLSVFTPMWQAAVWITRHLQLV